MTVLVKLIAKYSNWLYAVGLLGILFYLRIAFLAGRERTRAVFSLEREAATGKAYQALVAAFAFAAGMGLVFLVTTVIAPRLELPPEEEETPFAFVIPTSTPTPLPPTETPTPTPTRLRPTVELQSTPTDTPVPTNTPLPPAPLCPNPKARLTTPAMNAVLKGAVQISGSANIDDFQYYKVEVGAGENPTSWSLITDLRYNPVAGGLLDIWDTTSFPAGVYKIRLVVVDNTGNFPEPCEVRVIVEH